MQKSNTNDPFPLEQAPGRQSVQGRLNVAPFDQQAILAVGLFFIVYLAIGLLIYRDYGVSWDEIAQMKIGQVNYDYLRGKNQDLLTYDDRYYGPAFETLLTASYRFVGQNTQQNILYLRHLITFLFFYVSVFFFYLLCAQRFKSWKMGLLGSLFLIISPGIFSHSFYNSKDIPFLSACIIAVYTMVRFRENRTWLNALAHGFACALAIDIRIPGVFLPVMTLVMLAIDWIEYAITKQDRAFYRKDLPGLLIFLLALAGFSVLMFPLSWRDPLNTFLQAYHEMSRYPWTGKTLYFGHLLSAKEIPWHYVLVYMALTTPFFYLVNFVVGLVAALAALVKRPVLPLSTDRKQDFNFFAVVFSSHWRHFFISQSVLYNGWRQMFFCLPGVVDAGFNRIFHLDTVFGKTFQLAQVDREEFCGGDHCVIARVSAVFHGYQPPVGTCLL